MTSKKELLDEYKKNLGQNATARQYVTLEGSNSDNPFEFECYGNRLAAFYSQRFEAHSTERLKYQSVLEIGCGMGRILKPLSHRFTTAAGIDISAEILAEAAEHLRDCPNVMLYENDGLSLEQIPDATFDCVLCAGVMQHIPRREIIAGYIQEAIRVLVTDGLFVFSFQVWQSAVEGRKRVGAKFTAQWLSEVFRDLPAELLEISSDTKDPLPHFVVVIRKADTKFANDFCTQEVIAQPFRTTCWADLESMTYHQELEREGQRPITFYDPE